MVKNGLGNQMFQYAYARYIQECYKKNGINENLILNPFYFNKKQSIGSDKREMSLNHLNLNDKIKILHKKKQKIDFIRFQIRTYLSVSVLDLYKWIVLKQKPLGEEKFLERANKGIYYTFFPYTFFKTKLCNKKNKYIYGFYQDERNFHAISDIIKSELLVKTIPSDINKKMIENLNSCNSVCLHIRRGDYLNLKWRNLQICDFDYYNKSINYILNHVDNPTFFVFSNTHEDIEWIKTNYQFRDLSGFRKINIKYIDFNNPDYEELRLMYNCKHFIISNSTFSWWGAYLASHINKIVLAPKRWNLTCENDSDIYLNDWIKI